MSKLYKKTIALTELGDHQDVPEVLTNAPGINQNEIAFFTEGASMAVGSCIGIICAAWDTQNKRPIFAGTHVFLAKPTDARKTPSAERLINGIIKGYEQLGIPQKKIACIYFFGGDTSIFPSADLEDPALSPLYVGKTNVEHTKKALYSAKLPPLRSIEGKALFFKMTRKRYQVLINIDLWGTPQEKRKEIFDLYQQQFID
jgi:chemotaxis receptor (MCP) glutamine deamidase CheD